MSVASFFRDKSVLITGASSGIGEELARQLAEAGAKLTLAARRRGRLESLAQTIAAAGNPAPVVAECDVTRDGDLERAVAAAVQTWGRLDVAVANAGFGVVGRLEKLTLADYRRQFETNVFGVLRTIYGALPELKKTRGNLVLMGSIAGWAASPGTSPYAMSKFALRALANSIAPELRGAGVAVTLITPGFVASDIRRVDNRGNFHPHAPEPISPWLLMSTPSAVRRMLRAVARGRREEIITAHGKFIVAIERVAPWLNRALAAALRARSAR